MKYLKFSWKKILSKFKIYNLEYRVITEDLKIRNGKLLMPHGPIDTPTFMPVGTQATIKGLTTDEIQNLTFQIILSNAYHLSHRPGINLN